MLSVPRISTGMVISDFSDTNRCRFGLEIRVLHEETANGPCSDEDETGALLRALHTTRVSDMSCTSDSGGKLVRR